VGNSLIDPANTDTTLLISNASDNEVKGLHPPSNDRDFWQEADDSYLQLSYVLPLAAGPFGL
jgi:hypothetical protein